MAGGPIAFQPRNTGEILDDAWRQVRSDGVALLVLGGLFQVPAFCALLWLLAHPLPTTFPQRLLMPLATAALLALTGLGSGACQELLRRRAENQAVFLTGCLNAAWRRGLGHVTARASVLVGVLLGLFCVLMPGLTLWIAASTVHAALAYTKTGSLGEVRLGREARFDAVKSAVVVLTRLPIFAFSMANLVLVVQVGLWVIGNLGGFDVALLAVQLSPENLLFLLASGLFGWLLLTPYFEASNFPLHFDTRTRQEGLDLRYRVEQVFSRTEARRATGVAVILALLLGLPGLARAEEPLDSVRGVRSQLEKIQNEVMAADPYPGGGRWTGRLDDLTRQLEEVGPSRFRWLRKGLDGFGQLGQARAVEVLTDLGRRLQVVEELLSPGGAAPGPGRDEIKGLLRPRDDTGKPTKVRQEPRKEIVKQKPEKRDEQTPHDQPEDDPLPSRRQGGGMIKPGAGTVSGLFWPIVVGLLLAVLAAALVLWFRRRQPPTRPGVKTTTAAPVEPAPAAPHEQTPAVLFRQAEELARAGRFQDATRSLYHAVLSLLHRQQMLRYETTRTNGEYVRQVRLAPSAPPGLHEPFARLTSLFDSLWYGDQSCAPNDYSTCRELAEEIRQGVPSA
jgi:Domain of unknown function (DUF4129)